MWKKCLVLLLAFLLLAGLMSVPAKAAAEDITLTYLDNRDGTTKESRILVGNSAKVHINKKDYQAAQSELPLALTYSAGGAVAEADANISPGGATDTYNITVNASALKGADTADFSVVGNFNAIMKDGISYESYGGANLSGGAKYLTDDAVTGRSAITITTTMGEDPNTAVPSFWVRPSAVGSFVGYTGVNVDKANSTFGMNVRNKKVTVTLTGAGKSPLKIEFYPQMEHIGILNNAGDPVNSSGEKLPALDNTPNNYIRKGTEFTLEFSPPTSTKLLLTAATPQYVADAIATDVSSDKNVYDNSLRQYVLLKGDDSLNLITQSFQLRSQVNRYNAQFDIDWTWTPDPGHMDTGGEPPPDSETLQKVIDIPTGGNSALRTAIVNPIKWDVPGKLEAVVYYKDKAVTHAETVFDVTVRGTGTPAYLTRYSQTVGGKAEEVFTDTGIKSPVKLDVFRAGVDNYTKAPDGPYEYVLRLHMGKNNAASQYAVATLTPKGQKAVSLRTRPNATSAAVSYNSGEKIGNPAPAVTGQEGEVDLLIRAESPGDVKLTVDFYVNYNGKDRVDSTHSVDFTVVDTSPSGDSSLKSLSIYNQKSAQISFPFQPSKLDYTATGDTVRLPYKTEYINLLPLLNDPKADRMITMRAIDAKTGNPIDIFPDHSPGVGEDISGAVVPVESGKRSTKLVFAETNVVRTVELTVAAQNPNYTSTYKLNIMREPPSDDDMLKTFGLYLEADTASKTNLIKGFDPLNPGPYAVSVPYGSSFLRAAAEAGSPDARPLGFSPKLEKKNLLGKEEWLKLDGLDTVGDGYIPFRVSVLPEDESVTAPRVYEARIYREPPSQVSSLKTLKAADPEEKALKLTPTFKSTVMGPYRIEIPYSTKSVKLQVTPTDARVSDIYALDKKTGRKYDLTKTGVYSDAVPIDAMTPAAPYHQLEIHVLPESGEAEYESVYLIQVERAEPSGNNRLKDLIIKDQDGKQEKSFLFQEGGSPFAVTVPYETERVSFVPTAEDPNAEIEIKEAGALIGFPNKVQSGSASKLFDLPYDNGTPKGFTVVVTAESGAAKEYVVNLTRGAPSGDARLKSLTAQNVDSMEPIFISTRLDYDAVVSKGAPGVTVTATANHPGATLKINGWAAVSGQPTELIELLEIEQKVEIEVTAQDGKTRQVYSISFRNENLVEKTSNADLRRLTVNYGQMTPNFKPAITEYEVAATEDAYSVDVLPRTADRLATMQVFAGTKEIGDYDGNYSQALVDGENVITVKVTSPDETVTKDYTVTVYRNEEDELKNLTPLEADDIDFENSDDVIIVMIDEYPRVSADVFTELRKYPEKTIIFQGNDYSLEFQASDLGRVIPQTEIYDFRMSFTSPDEDDIYDRIDSRGSNDDIINRAVMLYFSHEGSLPGPATLHVSLGRRYADDTLYWHYYNKERDRIDYYGKLHTNSKGTFAVTIDHFSTFITTPRHKIAGSENKDGTIDEIGTQEGESLGPSKKVNPFTGVTEAAP